ncbi:early endosome antigen 1-like [Schistocerca gregaria]|uniref:early endosome antigen 1-like n=1 Tax=Schistocerca gregaria TaxID=7010 RepID=UPI00211EC520|nr:early endosome antigen 1-like [Schistocerca gregaria]XP_049835429.1 early endosome antigen 1-like [Schistocerca gregaria]
MPRANVMSTNEEIVDLSSILDEVFKKQNEVEKQVDTARQDLEKVKLQHQNEKNEYEGVLRKRRNSEMQLNNLKESIADIMTSLESLYEKTENISFATGDKQFQQAKASLILSHEMVHHNKYYQIMEKYGDNQLSSAANIRDQTLYTRKKLLENKIAENRRQVNMNLQTESKLKEEILILKKRNNALLIRLQRQLHEAQCRCSQAEERLSRLKRTLEEQKHIIQKNQTHK